MAVVCDKCNRVVQSACLNEAEMDNCKYLRRRAADNLPNTKRTPAEIGLHVTAFAARMGWTEETGEGPFEFLTRIHYAAGFRAARRSPDEFRSAWAIIWPQDAPQNLFGDKTGQILADSTFATEDDAWRVGLGWPSEEEIEFAKKNGVTVRRVTIL